jgi:hypothetical protein
MRYSASEKYEIIQLVERSDLLVIKKIESRNVYYTKIATGLMVPSMRCALQNRVNLNKV